MTDRPWLGDIVRAEVAKLASRTSVRLSVALMVAVSVGVPLLMLALSQVIVTGPAAGDGVPETVGTEFYGATVFRGVLALRNFFLFRALIIAVVAVSFAGEFASRTLREDLVRPVSRATVLAGKWVGLQVFVATGALVPLLVGLPLSMLLFGATGDFGVHLQRLYLVWLGDAGFATLVMAISLLVRSVPGTIGGVFLYWVLDRTVGAALWGVENFRPVLEQVLVAMNAQDLGIWLDRLAAIRPWLPSAAFEVWWDWDPAGALPWRSLVALGIYTALAYGMAWWAFRRTDVD